MNTSLFELFKIGIGPSSSHTVGPMRAALRFVRGLEEQGLLARTASVCAELYGSLALTGIGHGTDRAVLLGLLGEAPDTVDPAKIEGYLTTVRESGSLLLGGTHEIAFRMSEHLLLHRDEMYPPGAEASQSHPNGMRYTACDAGGALLAQEVFYSIGGGFILSAAELAPAERAVSPRVVPFPFSSAEMLLDAARKNGLTIAELLMANECALLRAEQCEGKETITRPRLGPSVAASEEERIREGIQALWLAMQNCTKRGIETEGILPGGLNVRRRAPRLSQRIAALDAGPQPRDPLAPLDWVSLFAIAVNEENAAGGRVVTAPTNGAAGVIPAIAHYYMRFIETDKSAAEKDEGLLRFFLTAAAIGILYKENASISGAEVGCQGEVGVACSMAAGGLVAALNGTNEQVEHAAEIAMEHNLGMTCDPIGGLVQIPCIERNAMGAVKAVNACRMAMHETEGHKLSLDQVIETMYRTGMDMQSRYKETSLAGLALNIIEC
ncbi:L-serine ammonia-lyase [Granulicella sp. WH15]|uniref:L-serine ammonia-lyase n=1 Tax=Granulicella sp. WH15 TaxID=2602070 RepID=UPI0013673554|nr:L-serine ammonia-lyase [Granulicella sp. WH15]QHN04889.1 L-serine ammonia-lyase [Granulicella sp. WH15]